MSRRLQVRLNQAYNCDKQTEASQGDVQTQAGVVWFCSGSGGERHGCDCTYNTSNYFGPTLIESTDLNATKAYDFIKWNTESVRKYCLKIKYLKLYLFWKTYSIHMNGLYIGKTIWKFWPKVLMVKYIEMLIINAKMNTALPKTVKSTWALRRRKG